MTKAQEVYERVEALMAEGKTKAEAFKQLAGDYGQPVNSIRGSYYSYSRNQSGGSSRPRRRETTPDDALADARKALERAIENIDREVEAAKTRAEEAKAEYEAVKASAPDRKQAIQERLEALR
jgi:chromosome segregation ATPase